MTNTLSEKYVYMCDKCEYMHFGACKNLLLLGYVLTLEGLVRNDLYYATESIDPGKHTSAKE